jgi:predicted chitinase
MEQCGLPRTRSALARSWLDWGEDAGDFVPGCVIVLPRGTGAHVGFFAGFDEAGHVRLLGGNQHDSVSVSSFPNATDNFLGRRVLTGATPVMNDGAAQTGEAADTKALLIQAMDRHGIRDNELRAGIAAIAGGESGLKPRSEKGWSHSDPAYAQRIFRSGLGEMTLEDIRELAADDDAFFSTVYVNKLGKGPVESHDGYIYRGRGIFQLTGRANYQKYGQLLKPPIDLEREPERANDPQIAVEVAVIYMLDRYQGGGFSSMKEAVGNSIGPPDANKDQLFAEYRASGEFDSSPSSA